MRYGNQSPLYWRIGRITEVRPGDDGISVAAMPIIEGSFKRAVSQYLNPARCHLKGINQISL